MPRENALQQTKGYFKLAGIVSGVNRDDFFTEKLTQSANPKNRKSIKFAVQTSPNNKVFVTLAAMPMDKVYFSKKAEKKGEKSTTKSVDWDKRHSFNEDGFSIIGTNVGLSKKLNEEGKEVNDIKHLVPYDAIDHIKDNLKDGMSVFIRGSMEYSNYEGRNIKQFTIGQISLCQPIDFQAEGFKEQSNFEQPIVFMSVEKDEQEADKYTLIGSIVTYNNIIETDFALRGERGAKMFQNFKKRLKPYTALTVSGNLVGRVEEVVAEDDDDGWGEPNPMRAMSSYAKEMLITSADKDSIDTELYSEKAFDEFMRDKKEFGDTARSKATVVSDEDDDEDWDDI